MQHNLARYDRQMRYTPLGEAGQQKLVESTALIVGCGALGSVIAQTLARAGVGTLRIVDRDFLELSNLQRQVLFDEADVAAGLPKAIAAAAKLRAINSEITIEPHVVDLTHKNIAALANNCGVVVDGSDNFEVRFLVNDYAISTGTPWVFGGCLGAEGQTMTIVPTKSPCLACVIPEPPPPGSTPSCDTAGILGPAINVIASIEACEAIKILSGNIDAVATGMTVIDVWYHRLRTINFNSLSVAGGCYVCGHREFYWLRGERGSRAAVLCGRNAVQLRPDEPRKLDLARVAVGLKSVGELLCNNYLLRLDVDDYSLTLFPDGRAIIVGTDSESTARSLYARYFGS